MSTCTGHRLSADESKTSRMCDRSGKPAQMQNNEKELRFSNICWSRRNYIKKTMKANFSPLDAGPHRCTPQGTLHSLSKTPLQNQWITKYGLSASNRPLTLAGWILMHRANSSSADKWDTATFNVHNKPALAIPITGLSLLQHIEEVYFLRCIYKKNWKTMQPV